MAKYRYSSSPSIDSEQKRMYIIIGVCAVVVVVGLVLCLTLQSGKDPEAIPVVEQGDGVTEPDVVSSSTVSPSEVIHTSDGDIVIDEGNTPTDKFTVTVTDADGEYHLTGVKKAQAATLTVSGQTAESFSFTLLTQDGTLSGTAYFNGADTAVCEAGGAANFRFQSGGIDLYITGQISALGSATVDGRYILDEPVYTDALQTDKHSYDIAIRTSTETKNVLTATLPQADIALIDELLAMYPGGNGIIPAVNDPVRDKNGNPIQLDKQLDAVQYYAYEPGTGREVVLICAPGGKIYAGVCDGSEYRYYTNDSAYASKAPNSISLYAQAKGMDLQYK